MTNLLNERADAWSRYWSRGAQHSCAGSYDETLQGAIGDFWREGLVRLPLGARVLDLATGSGTLPRLLLALPDRQDLHCDAVDLATPAPAWVKELAPPMQARLQFHPSCAMETLPFAEASFDAVLSQWGFEYSDLARSVPELLRVLKPAGEVQMLLHHHLARPVLLAEEEMAHIDWLRQTEGFWPCVAQLLAPMALAASPEGRRQLQNDPEANRLRQRFNELQDQLRARAQGGQCADILDEVSAWVGPLFRQAAEQGQAAALSSWQNLQLELDDAQLRLRELRAHALDEPAARALAQSLAGTSPFELQTLNDRGAVMGWSLRIKRQP